MSAIILMTPKNNKDPKLKDFLDVIDSYISAQNWLILDTIPRIYYIASNISPTNVRSLITTIKNTKGYTNIFKDIFYSHNLTKG